MKKIFLIFLFSFSYSSFCSEQKREKNKIFIKQLSRLKAALILENKKTAPVRIDNYFSSVKKFSGMVIFVPGLLVLEIEKIKELSGLIRAFRKLPTTYLVMIALVFAQNFLEEIVCLLP